MRISRSPQTEPFDVRFGKTLSRISSSLSRQEQGIRESQSRGDGRASPEIEEALIGIVGPLTNLILIVFLWALNISQGMSLTLTQVLAPFKRWATILLAVALNAVLVPLMFWGFTFVMPMSSDQAIGFMLIGFAAAAPIGVKAAMLERGDVPLAIGLVVLLGALNVIVVPLWTSLLLPAGTVVNPLQIALTLVKLVLLPLSLGLVLKARWAALAGRFVPITTVLTNVALVAFVALTAIVNVRAFIALFGSPVILAAVLALGASGVLGYLIGYDTPSRRALASVTVIRAGGPAIAVATTAFAGNQQVIVTCVGLAVSLVLLALFVPAAWGRATVGAPPEDAAPA